MKLTIEFAEKEKELIEEYLAERGYPYSYLCSKKSADKLTLDWPDQVRVTAIEHGYIITIDYTFGVELIELLNKYREVITDKIDVLIYNNDKITMNRNKIVYTAKEIFADPINKNIAALYCYIDKYDIIHYINVDYGNEFVYDDMVENSKYHMFIERNKPINYDIEDSIHQYNMSVIKSNQKDINITELSDRINPWVIKVLNQYLDRYYVKPELIIAYNHLDNVCVVSYSRQNVNKLICELEPKKVMDCILKTDDNVTIIGKEKVLEYLYTIQNNGSVSHENNK